MARALGKPDNITLPCPICEKRTSQAIIDIFYCYSTIFEFSDMCKREMVELTTVCNNCSYELKHDFTQDVFDYLMARIGKVEN